MFSERELSGVKWLMLVFGTAVLYFIAAKLSLVFAIPPGFASAVWPPAGIACAALLLGGSTLWPGVWLGLAAANLTVQPSVVTPFAIGIGGALEAWFIAWGMQRVIGRPAALFTSANHVFRFVGLTLAGAAISATIANVTLFLAGTVHPGALSLNWLTWWLGDSMGVLLVVPWVLAFTSWRSMRLARAQVLELALALASLLVVTILVFFDSPLSTNTQPLMFLLPPPLIWIAARFGARSVTSASALACVVAMLATVMGQGPFVSASLNESLLLQQAFVCTIAIVCLALTVSINELRSAHEELQILVNLATHDLQEPVRNTLGFADLLQKRYWSKLDADGQEFLGYIVSGALRMRKLISDLLALSRASGTPLDPEITEAERSLEAALDGLALSVKETHAEVTRDRLPAVLAEPPLLEQIFQNLIGNALKFRGVNPPRIHVASRREGRWEVISVRDNGIGIAPEYHQKIFGMFERLQGRGGGGGAGVGLALCRRIVERYGGRIWIESGAMGGSTFYFTLPGVNGARQ